MFNPIWRRWLRRLSSALTGASRVVDALGSSGRSWSSKPVRSEQRFRVRLEELESRLAPASFAVNAQMQISRLDNLGDTPAGTHAIVFFESAVADYQVLRQGLGAGTDAVVLDSGGDGLRETAAFLAGRHDLTSIGVVAHGAPGEVALGTVALDAVALGSYRRELAAVGSALGAGGEIDLWSCDVATGQAGMSLMRSLATATGAAVAAADHTVGAAPLGGVWQLEIKEARARGEVPFSAAAIRAFHELLGIWGSATSMPTARAGQTATLLSNGHVLVVGGAGISGYLSDAELYDPVSDTWASAGSIAPVRSGHTATLLNNGIVLITGGHTAPPARTSESSAELYDPVTNSWSSAGSMAVARDLTTATLLSNGKVLVAGGYDTTTNAALSSAELYDPVTNSWSSAGSMVAARDWETATLLSNGKVLVTGGFDTNNNPLSSVELYDPVTNTWSSAPSMANARARHTATPLTNGLVLVAGGVAPTGPLGGVLLSSSELYDPASNTWASAASMATARDYHTATLLANGTVLVAGGATYTGAVTSAEVYDPVSNTWSPAGSMATVRAFDTATLLGNGTVLFAGGNLIFGFTTPLSSAELYYADPADPSQSTIVVMPASIPSGGTATVTLTARNAAGNLKMGASFSLGLGAGVGSGTFSNLTENNNGTFTATFTGTTAGAITITATVDGQAITSALPTITVTAGPASPSHSIVTVPAHFVGAGTTMTVTMTAKDTAGYPETSGGSTVSFGLGIGTGSGTFSKVTDNNDGTYSATFTAAAPGPITITASLNGQPITSALPTVIVTSHTTTAMSSTPNPSAYGQSVTFTATVSAGGAPVPTGTVTFEEGSTFLADNVAVDANGQASFSIATLSVTPSAHVITALYNGPTWFIPSTGSTSQTVNLGAARFVVNILGGSTIVAGNTIQFTVQAVDGFGNPVGGPGSVTTTISPADPQGNFPISGTLNSSGFGSFVGKIKTAGSYTLTTTAGSVSGASTTFTVAPAAADHFAITTPTTATTGSPFNVTVAAYDPYGNIATGYSSQVHFTSSDPRATLPVDATLPGGQGTFSLTLNTGGSQTITTTDTAPNSTIAGTSSPITSRGLLVRA